MTDTTCTKYCCAGNCTWCGREVSRELMSTVYVGSGVFHGSCYALALDMAKQAKGES